MGGQCASVCLGALESWSELFFHWLQMVQSLHKLGIKMGVITNGHFSVRFSSLCSVVEYVFNLIINLLAIRLNFSSKNCVILYPAGPKEEAESMQA